MIQEPPKRVGPSWREVLFSLACTVLTATDVLYGRSSNLPQSVESYYMAIPAVQRFHTVDVGVNTLVVVCTLFWIVLPATRSVMKPLILLLALLGFGLCWSEVVWATNLDTHGTFHLTNLPFRPVGNSGLLGAQVFGAYLILKMPSGKVREGQAVLLKIGLVVCLWLLQVLVWDGIRRAAGLAA